MSLPRPPAPRPVRSFPATAPVSAASLLACSLILGACARTADQIEPSYAEAPSFTATDCGSLLRRRDRVAEQLIFASIEQNQVAREDRERLFGIAPSMFGTLFRGDVSPRVAELKSQRLEIEAALVTFGCVAPPY